MADDRFESLRALVGEWRTTITMRNADGSDGAVSTASDTYTWSANGKFVQHDVDAEMSGDRVQSMEIIALDPGGVGYTTRSYDPDGTFSDFKAELQGKSWQLLGELQRFKGTFTDDGRTLSGEWEQNDGDGNWSPLMKVVLRRRH